jgi:predicted Zn finger-like uncharacterized protein
MIIVCPHCGILYGVDPSDLAAESRTVRCSNCDREWLHTPAAALPDNDDALRLLAASFGRDGRGSPPASPPGPHRPEVAPVSRSSRREKEEARQQRPRAVAAEPEAAPRPAPVTTLYQTLPATPKATGEPPPRGTRLSSRQLDALLNGAATDTADADASAVDALQAEPRSNEDRGWRPEPGRLSVGAQEMAKPDAAPTVEPARALNASEDETDAPPPASDNDTAEATSPPRRGPLLRRHGAAVLAAGAVAATLLVSVGLLAATRGLVLAAFPGAAGFYSAVGLAPADSFAEGLEIRGVSSTRSWSDGEQILTVAGDLANVAEQPRSLPMVRVVLVDGSDAEVQEVVVVPPGETLPVGESIRFEARISNPADTAQRIKVSLAPRPEPS